MKVRIQVPLEIPPPGRKRTGAFLCKTVVDAEIEEVALSDIPVAARTVDGRGTAADWLHDGVGFVCLFEKPVSPEEFERSLSKSLLTILMINSDMSGLYPAELRVPTRDGRPGDTIRRGAVPAFFETLPDLADVKTGLSEEAVEAKIARARSILRSRKLCEGRQIGPIDQPLLENRFGKGGVRGDLSSDGAYRQRGLDRSKLVNRKVWKDFETAYWQAPNVFRFPLVDFDAWRLQAAVDYGRTPWTSVPTSNAPESVEIFLPEVFSRDIRALEFDRHIRMALMYGDRLLRNKAGEWRYWLPQDVVDAHARLSGLVGYDAAYGVPTQAEEAFRGLVDRLDAYRRRSRRKEDWQYVHYAGMALDQWDNRPLDITAPSLAAGGLKP